VTFSLTQSYETLVADKPLLVPLLVETLGETFKSNKDWL